MPGTLSRQLLSNKQPARCSWPPDSWLGVPAINTTFLSAAHEVEAKTRTLRNTESVAASRESAAKAPRQLHAALSRDAATGARLKARSRESFFITIIARLPRARTGENGLIEHLDTHVLELDLHGRAGMNLEGEDAGFGGVGFLLVNDIDGLFAIDEMLKMVAFGDDRVKIPTILIDGLLDFLGVAH